MIKICITRVALAKTVAASAKNGPIRSVLCYVCLFAFKSHINRTPIVDLLVAHQLKP